MDNLLRPPGSGRRPGPCPRPRPWCDLSLSLLLGPVSCTQGESGAKTLSESVGPCCALPSGASVAVGRMRLVHACMHLPDFSPGPLPALLFLLAPAGGAPTTASSPAGVVPSGTTGPPGCCVGDSGPLVVVVTVGGEIVLCVEIMTVCPNRAHKVALSASSPIFDKSRLLGKKQTFSGPILGKKSRSGP